MITAKSTKAEILAAYKASCTAYNAAINRLAEPVMSWPVIVNTAKLIAREIADLANDTYRFGRWCRKGFDRMLDEMRMIVNN